MQWVNSEGQSLIQVLSTHYKSKHRKNLLHISAYQLPSSKMFIDDFKAWPISLAYCFIFARRRTSKYTSMKVTHQLEPIMSYLATYSVYFMHLCSFCRDVCFLFFKVGYLPRNNISFLSVSILWNSCMSVEMLTAMSQIAKFMGPAWGPLGSYRPQMGPMLAPWTLLSRVSLILFCFVSGDTVLTPYFALNWWRGYPFQQPMANFINSSSPGQNGHHFYRRHVEAHFLEWKYYNFFSIFTEVCSPRVPIDNIPALVR